MTTLYKDMNFIQGYIFGKVEKDILKGFINKEKEILLAQIKNDPKNANKPDAILEKMIGGKINKYYTENCLLQQKFVKDDKVSVEKYLAANGVKLVDYVRFEKGEGLEKREDNFADEVASMIK